MLNKAQRNYYITQWELLAIVRTLEHFHKYLYGKEFYLPTDHSALTWFMSFKNLENKLPARFSAYKSTTSLLNTIKVKKTTIPMHFEQHPEWKTLLTTAPCARVIEPKGDSSL
jgi:hypothetical protein